MAFENLFNILHFNNSQFDYHLLMAQGFINYD
jgi:hypothetical protein